MIEKVIFYILAFALFIIICGKFIKRKDKTYVYFLVIQLFGIIVRLLTNDYDIGLFVLCFLYILCIIIPVMLVILENKRIYISEAFAIISANFFLKRGNTKSARLKLVNLLSKYPNSYYAHKLLAKIYEKEGKREDAIDEYVKAVDINPKDYDSYFQITVLLNKIKKSDQAERMLKELLIKKPDYYKASELLGTILYDKEDFTQAVDVYQRALKYNPDRYELYYSLGMAYTRLNDFQTAKEYYEKAATINSMLYHGKLNIAQIALITGDLDEAEELFTACLQSKDSEGYAYYYLAIISLLKGEEDRALNYINVAIELDNDIYQLVYKHDIFSNIRKQIKASKTQNCTYNYTVQELKTRAHLDETFILIDKMKNNNIKVKRNEVKNIEINEKTRDEY